MQKMTIFQGLIFYFMVDLVNASPSIRSKGTARVGGE